MFPIPDVNSTVQFVQYVNNDLVQGMLGIGILILCFSILFVRMSAAKSSFAFMTSAFFTSLLGIVLWGLELVTDIILIACIIIAIIAGVILFISDKK